MITTSNCEAPFDNDNKTKRANISNKDAILRILNTLDHQHPSNKDIENPIDIGVIAGYSGQVELLSQSIDVKSTPILISSKLMERLILLSKSIQLINFKVQKEIL